MADFDGVWRKVARTRQHLDDLETGVVAYQETGPFEVGVDQDPDNEQAVFKISRIREPIPDELATVAGDAVHNLRTALDHFACVAVATPSENTAFPVWRKSTPPTTGQMNGLVGGKMAGASRGLVTALCHLQPYVGGTEEYVRTLDYLDIVDKHRLLLTVGATYSGLTVDMAEMMRRQWETVSDIPFDLPDGAFALTLKPDDWGPVTEGFVLYRVPSAQFEDHKDTKFIVNIALGEPPALAGEPIVASLRDLTDSVEGLIRRLTPLV